MDANALCDRLYADALAADLRVPERFLAPKTTEVSWGDIKKHVRERAGRTREGSVAAASFDGRPIQSRSGSMADHDILRLVGELATAV